MKFVQSSGQHQLITIILTLIAVFLIGFGTLVAFSYPFVSNVSIDLVATAGFEPAIAVISGLCLIIPGIVVAIAAFVSWRWLGRSSLEETVGDLQTELKETQRFAFDQYLDELGEMAGRWKGDQNRELIEEKTLKILKMIDGDLKRKVVEFLIDSNLIGEVQSISLRDADLSRAQLQNLDLTRINFAGANLTDADLTGAKITSQQHNDISTFTQKLPRENFGS